MLDIFSHPLEAYIICTVDVESPHLDLRFGVTNRLGIVLLDYCIHELVMQFAIAYCRLGKHEIVVFWYRLPLLSDFSLIAHFALLFLDGVYSESLWVSV